MSPAQPTLIGLAAWCGLALVAAFEPVALGLWWGAGSAAADAGACPSAIFEEGFDGGFGLLLVLALVRGL